MAIIPHRTKDSKPWLNHSGAYLLPVKYIINHLHIFDQIKVLTDKEDWRSKNIDKKYLDYCSSEMGHLNMVEFMTWQQSKEHSIEKALNSGISSKKITPIQMGIIYPPETFSIINGITRLRIFNKMNIEDICVNMH